ncbi:hypothetical protein QCA50_011921 [Cerrena zonata]|uniref:F-box domain-containing protein n=1 Tax=Cerrena zonata TaxID=2478898 RepID=A0AAW0G149_9APHY
MDSLEQSTVLIPVIKPPTPAPSPGLTFSELPPTTNNVLAASFHRQQFALMSPEQRRELLGSILADCTPTELLFVSSTVTPLLKRDFLQELPPELACYILSFVEEPQTLTRASAVSRRWNQLISDEWLWKRLCYLHGFEIDQDWPPSSSSTSYYRSHFKREFIAVSNWCHGGSLLRTHRVPFNPGSIPDETTSPPPNRPNSSAAIPTSIAIDSEWVVVGLANSKIHVFSARTGVLSRTLVGHASGVWAVALIRSGGEGSGIHTGADVDEGSAGDSCTDEDVYEGHTPTIRHALGLDSPKPMHRRKLSDVFEGSIPIPKPSEPSGASDGWGQPNALVVSGGCDKEVRVWDAKSGFCIYSLSGHQSTIRCLKVLHGRPIAVTGSRDRTVRVWDIQRGKMLRVLEGHDQSVRCIDVCGNICVSGSYDTTCRVWNVDTGECLHVLRGHYHQIYTVAFDGARIASGGLDTTVRVWDVHTGACLALLQGHTALVCQLQLTPTMLATGGSDGRVITFSLLGSSFEVIQRLVAHDSSVTALQLDDRFMVTGGNDGRVRLFQFPPQDQIRNSTDVIGMESKGSAEHMGDPREGLIGIVTDGEGKVGKCEYVRELSDLSESVWKVAFTRSTCAIAAKKSGKTVVEIWRFRLSDVE